MHFARLQGRLLLFIPVAVILYAAIPASSQESVLTMTPSQTTIGFTLSATLHTVHGTFALKQGTLHFYPATGAISGEILVDATSGSSGNTSRDAKMHQEVLESARFREITFIPDRIEGRVEPQGKSTVQVHGMFGIHGTEHEVTLPVQVEMGADHWTAIAHFAVPYVAWGMRNPSTFVLRVSQSVDLDIHAEGTLPRTKP